MNMGKVICTTKTIKFQIFRLFPTTKHNVAEILICFCNAGKNHLEHVEYLGNYTIDSA